MEEQNTQTQQKASYAIPVAIVIAGLLISGTVYFSQGGAPGGTIDKDSSSTIENIAPLTASDHILGDFNAPVKLVEFSDLECSFCKKFHETVSQIMNEYGPSGQVAWVYRHFPLTQIHPKAIDSAIASECANELGGNIGFWKFINEYFRVTPSNNQIDLNLLPDIAESAGINKGGFEACLINNDYESLVQVQYNNAVDSGGQGTPYSIVVASNGKKFVISGAQPYEVVKDVIEQALQEK
jgi:protein-disulfide isomerase